MKKLIFLLLILPLLVFSQESPFEKSIKYKVAMMQNFVQKGEDGELAYWQTKGKVTYAIVNYTEEQNPKFKELFISQYRELVPIYQKMIQSYDERDTHQFMLTLIRQEEDYRKMLQPDQLQRYSKALTEMQAKDPKLSESYTSLFFTDALLAEYKKRF